MIYKIHEQYLIWKLNYIMSSNDKPAEKSNWDFKFPDWMQWHSKTYDPIPELKRRQKLREEQTERKK